MHFKLDFLYSVPIILESMQPAADSPRTFLKPGGISEKCFSFHEKRIKFTRYIAYHVNLTKTLDIKWKAVKGLRGCPYIT